MYSDAVRRLSVSIMLREESEAVSERRYSCPWSNFNVTFLLRNCSTIGNECAYSRKSGSSWSPLFGLVAMWGCKVNKCSGQAIEEQRKWTDD
jgi:hypothetical protein